MHSLLEIKPVRGLRGDVRVPGDKSISHRSVMLATLLDEPVRIRGFLHSDDCLATLEACRLLGLTSVEGENDADPGDGVLHVVGRGAAGLAEPPDVIDVGNAGTGIRLLAGLVTAHPIFAVLTGDRSIRRRPMDRIVEPLRRMGAKIEGRSGGRWAPLAVRGGGLKGMEYHLPVASAQVKSALLLAGLFAEGETVLTEPAPSRDHTERMLTALGADLTYEPGRAVLRGGTRLKAPPGSSEWRIPGDFSSAAFFIVAALITPDSDVTIRDVGLNPTRTGLLDILAEMGADLETQNIREWNGEPVGDIRVRSSRLRGVDVRGSVVPRAIDELPIWALAAARAEGASRLADAAELRVKEANRIDGLAEQFARVGIKVEPTEDGFTVEGDQAFDGGVASSLGDHRLAMTLAVAGLASREAVTVEDVECIGASFPGFAELLQQAVRGESSR